MNYFKIIIMLLCVFVISSAANAEDGIVDQFLKDHEVVFAYAPWCKHVIQDGDHYNERNHAFLFAVDQWYVITFKNSYGDQTYGAGYTFRTLKWEPLDNDLFLRANLLIGAVYGYENRNIEIAGISPAGALTGEIGYKNVSLHLMALPVVSLVIAIEF